jgi:hypothetical protein
MTFLYTARIRGLDPKATLEKALNMLCCDPDADIAGKRAACSPRSLITEKLAFQSAVKTEPLRLRQIILSLFSGWPLTKI